MRVLLLLLLLANLVFLAWTQYSTLQAATETHLVDQQINREAIRVLSPSQVDVARREPPKTVACMELGSFNLTDASKVDELLAPLGLGGRLYQHRIDESANWWVFMPPQAGREGAQKKVAELTRLGVQEYFILVDDPKFLFAISLGVFRSEEAARNRLEELRARGVRTMQVGRRATPVQRMVYEIRAVDDVTSAKLAEIKAEFASVELKECAKPAAPVDAK